MGTYRRIGDWMLAQGLISPAQLAEALELHQRTRRRLGDVLVAKGWVTEEDVARCLSEQFDLPIADPRSLQPSSEALRLVPVVFALSHLFLPVSLSESEFFGVTADPLDIGGTDALAQAIGKPVRLAVAPPTALRRAIERFYGLPVRCVSEQNLKRKKPRKRALDEQRDRAALLELLEEHQPAPVGLVELRIA
ncbi:MAG: hypothetical protein ACK41F_01095 [Fimbriimonadaceae bacterium]